MSTGISPKFRPSFWQLSPNTKKPRGAGQTPSVKPCGFATSLSEGGSGETGSFAPAPGALPMRKAPSLRGLSPQATGGVCPKHNKSPGERDAPRGNSLIVIRLLAQFIANCNIGLSANGLSANTQTSNFDFRVILFTKIDY